MKLYYYKDLIGNFGDDLNPWLWSKLLPDLWDEDERTLFIGIGTILDYRIPELPLKLVFGAGIGYERLPVIDSHWKIYCVRGPLTASALGLKENLAITDPAILVSTIVPQENLNLYSASFIPHHITKIRASNQGINLKVVCDEIGINYINPSGNIDEVLFNIRNSNIIITEAMHGAIIADALRVPWIPVKIYDHILELKWWDWCKSLKLEYEPAVWSYTQPTQLSLSFTEFIKQVLSKYKPKLSNEHFSKIAIQRLQEQLEKLKQEYQDIDSIRGDQEFNPNPEVLKGIPWLYRIQLSIKEISELIFLEEDFILVNEGQWGNGKILPRRHALPFLEKDGQYWGPPPDDETAISELERLRQSGAKFIVFAWNAFWWLNYYKGLNDYLRSKYQCVLENERLIIFAL